jgi:hypothetical protein
MENNLLQEDAIHETDEPVDLEALAKAGHKPPCVRRYRIRIDKQYYIVEVPSMTGRELLKLAGKQPPTQYRLYQKFCGGERKSIGLDEKADFTTPGVERYMTLPLDQTEG